MKKILLIITFFTSLYSTRAQNIRQSAEIPSPYVSVNNESSDHQSGFVFQMTHSLASFSETHLVYNKNADNIDQEPKDSVLKPKNNAIYFTLAPDLVFWAAGLYYERIMYTWEKGKLFARAGYQGWAIIIAEGGDAIIFQPGIITGTNTGHFEAALGATYITSSENDGFFAPAVSVGYRRQKPGKRFLFRAGIGYPDGIYVSLGTSF